MEPKVIIIGSGVSGMTAAIYLKRAGISCTIIEKEMPGGQINYTSIIENYPGLPNINGSDLALSIYNQVTELAIPVIFDEVLEIIDNQTEKIIKTKKQEFKAEFVIIATGRSPKKLEALGEEKLLNKGISYCAICDGSLYKDKEVVVIGAGASSIKESLYLSNICKKVTIINRRDEFRKTEDTRTIKEKENINIIYNNEVQEFIGEDHLEKIKLKDNSEIEVEGCFIFIGYTPKTAWCKSLNITNKNGYIITDNHKETKIKNIYAIGDVTENHICQIIPCMNDAITTSFSIIEKINNK